MRTVRAVLVFSLATGLSLPLFPAGATRTRHRTVSHASSKSLTRKPAAHTAFQPHQRAIDDARATEIQQALARTGYLSTDPSGHWDDATVAAMTKLQSDSGWQTKLVPDSRALIKLGLGPSSTPATTTASVGTSANAQ